MPVVAADETCLIDAWSWAQPVVSGCDDEGDGQVRLLPSKDDDDGWTLGGHHLVNPSD